MNVNVGMAVGSMMNRGTYKVRIFNFGEIKGK